MTLGRVAAKRVAPHELQTSRDVRMRRQRGLTFVGTLFTLATLVGAYFGMSYLPIFKDDYLIKQLARGACNDFLGRNVTDAAGVEEMFSRAIAREPDYQNLKFQTAAVVDEEEWKFARMTVTYKRTWKLLFTKKSYVRSFKWTVTAER